MNRGFCERGMKCHLHHPTWHSEEHDRLKRIFNDSHGRDEHGYRKNDYKTKRTWGNSWQEHDNHHHGGDKWKQEEYQGSGQSSWQSGHQQTPSDQDRNDQQAKTYVYKDREGWHYIKMKIPETTVSSIKNDKSKSNKDAESLRTRIAVAATQLIDYINSH